jgi:hypothetical protein
MKTESFIITFNEDGVWKTIDIETLPIITITWNKENKQICLSLHTDFENYKFKNKVYNEFRLEITNDPTLNFAGGVVSLGYYVLRLILKNVKPELKYNQLLFKTKYIDGFSFQISRPARRPEFPDKKEGINYTITPIILVPQLEDSFVFSMLFLKDHSKDWTIIKSIKKTDEVNVLKLNPMSLFNPVEHFKVTKNVNETLLERHNKIINELK